MISFQQNLQNEQIPIFISKIFKLNKFTRVM